MGSTVFRIPSDLIKPEDDSPRVLYTSSGILNTIDPSLALASNLYVERVFHICLLIYGSRFLARTLLWLYIHTCNQLVVFPRSPH